MQLKFKRVEEKVGLFKNKTDFRIKSQLICTEEELMAVKKLGIDKRTFVEPFIWRKSDHGEIPIGWWIKSEWDFPTDDLMISQRIEGEIKETAKLVKEHVDQFIESGGNPETDELIEL